MESRV
jgi:hypothetical protein